MMGYKITGFVTSVLTAERNSEMGFLEKVESDIFQDSVEIIVNVRFPNEFGCHSNMASPSLSITEANKFLLLYNILKNKTGENVHLSYFENSLKRMRLTSSRNRKDILIAGIFLIL